ncbi:MAG: hypothetical protein RBS34_12850 [Desulfofustis sp.]|jgi:hypothetical protein|nr:hypothetical protein [Desulfofustis sp.]
MAGWIKLHRKIALNDLWFKEPFSKGQAWVDLLLIAEHEPRVVKKNGIQVPLERGDIGLDERSLAERWMWSRGKVRRFIAELWEMGMVERAKRCSTKVCNCISVVNYNLYQDNGAKENGTKFGTRVGTKFGTRFEPNNDTNETEKKESENDGLVVNEDKNGTRIGTTFEPRVVPNTVPGSVPIIRSKEERREEEKKKRSLVACDDCQSPTDDCPHEQIVDIYNEVLPELPKVIVWSKHRRQVLRSRWREDRKRQSLEWWREFFGKVARSDFLMGRRGDFRADLEWLIGAKNIVKVLEGRYDNNTPAYSDNPYMRGAK